MQEIVIPPTLLRHFSGIKRKIEGKKYPDFYCDNVKMLTGYERPQIFIYVGKSLRWPQGCDIINKLDEPVRYCKHNV